MDFFDNVVNKSNAILKERLNNPFGGSKQQSGEQQQSTEANPGLEETQPAPGAQPETTTTTTDGNTTTTAEDQPKRASQDSAGGESDKNSQFANIAADAEAVAQKAAKGAKTFGTFLFSMANKAGQTVSQTAKQVKHAVENTSILTDFTREQQDFIREHGGSLVAGQLPWQEVEDEEKSAYIKEQILSLSQDKRNFVRAPPSDSDFKFEAQTCYPIALSLLKEDPNLNKMRYELVPKLVNEDTFWCNYFYRVSMLKQMSEKGADARKGWSSSRSSSGEGPDEVNSDAHHAGVDGNDEAAGPFSPGYNTGSSSATVVGAGVGSAQSTTQKQDSFSLSSSSSDKANVISEPTSAQTATTFSSTQQAQQQQEQYQSSELESNESRKLVAEADDLKSKLRELNIGSLDDDDAKWEEELQRDLQEFELISGGDVDALEDEETLQNEIKQLEEQQRTSQKSTATKKKTSTTSSGKKKANNR